VCKGNTHKFIHLPIQSRENNIIIPKNIFVPYIYQLEYLEKFNEYYKDNNNRDTWGYPLVVVIKHLLVF